MKNGLLAIAAVAFAATAGVTVRAEVVPIMAYSQRDPAWAGDRMGNGGTIGQQGCMMTCVAMVLRVTPKTLNHFLNTNGGYAPGGLLNHPVAAAYDGPGGLQYAMHGPLPLNALAVSRGIGRGAVYIVQSSRFAQHWVLVFQASNTQAFYLDPWDRTVRPVGDAWVHYGNPARIYSVRY